MKSQTHLLTLNSFPHVWLRKRSVQVNVDQVTRLGCLCGSGKWSESGSVVSDSLRTHGLYSPKNSPGQKTGVGSLSLLQGIFPTQESNPGLPHGRWILYQLSRKGCPRILEWVAYPFSRGSSWPRTWTGVFCIEKNSLLTEISRKASSMNHGGSWKHQFIQIGCFLLSLTQSKTLDQGSQPGFPSKPRFFLLRALSFSPFSFIYPSNNRFLSTSIPLA